MIPIEMNLTPPHHQDSMSFNMSSSTYHYPAVYSTGPIPVVAVNMKRSSFDKQPLPCSIPKASKMSQLLASSNSSSSSNNILSSHKPPFSHATLQHDPHQKQQSKSNITFCCPKPSRQTMFSKSAAYLHTPPPSILGSFNPLANADEEDEEDDDDNDYDSENDEDEDDIDYEDQRYSIHAHFQGLQLHHGQRNQGVFLSD